MLAPPAADLLGGETAPDLMQMLEGEPCGLGVGLVAEEQVSLAAAPTAHLPDQRPASEGRGNGGGKVGAPCRADWGGLGLGDVLGVPALVQLAVGDVVSGNETLGGQRCGDGLRLGTAVLGGALEQGLDSVNDVFAVGGVGHGLSLLLWSTTIIGNHKTIPVV